jgi:hypothetical protein
MRPESSEKIVSDMVTSFLIPYAEKELIREKSNFNINQVSRDQQKYLMAAHDSIFNQIDSIEKEALAQIKANEEQLVSQMEIEENEAIHEDIEAKKRHELQENPKDSAPNSGVL